MRALWNGAKCGLKAANIYKKSRNVRIWSSDTEELRPGIHYEYHA